MIECSGDYGATHAKLAALPSLPGAPVNFGRFGHSHSGRERFALGFPSIAVRPMVPALLDPRLQRREAVDLRVERTETVAEAGNHVEADKLSTPA